MNQNQAEELTNLIWFLYHSNVTSNEIITRMVVFEKYPNIHYPVFQILFMSRPYTNYDEALYQINDLFDLLDDLDHRNFNIRLN